VVLSENFDRSPHKVIHLVFEDGTYFEIFSVPGHINGLKRVYRGGLMEVLHYVRSHSAVEVHHLEHSVISRDHARPIVERYLEDPPHRGKTILNIDTFDEIAAAKSRAWDMTDDRIREHWIAYLGPATQIGSCLIVLVHGITGESTYAGSAGDEG